MNSRAILKVQSITLLIFPDQACRRFTKDEICEACGANTDCEVGPDDTPICKCKQDYVGNPLQGCRRECETSRDCSQSQECQRFKCVPVCRQDGNIFHFRCLIISD